jgi:fungal STAND N-terminal Goodbye domain
MSDQSGSSRLQGLFEAALHDYEKQTGTALAEHPLVSQLQDCDSVESFTAVLRDQTQAFNEFRGREKFMNPFKNVLSVLYKLSTTANLGQDFSLVRRGP